MYHIGLNSLYKLYTTEGRQRLVKKCLVYQIFIDLCVEISYNDNNTTEVFKQWKCVFIWVTGVKGEHFLFSDNFLYANFIRFEMCFILVSIFYANNLDHF